MIRWPKRFLRNLLFRLLRRISETDEARTLCSRILKGQLSWQPGFSLAEGLHINPPYNDLGTSIILEQPAQRKDVIIISGRFRSGSTLLWNLFRNIDGMTAYYEPLNERRWFDPRTRGSKIDTTHRNVDEYWREYEGLNELGDYYTEEWIDKNLYMDASFWAPDMKKYIEILIEKAPGRPVLQFNRIDFRLPWIRKNFPNAITVHIYRHPRDQWCSALMDPQCFPKDGRMQDFPPHDKFYLCMWAQDLKYHFPFLDESLISHPYALFYYIWKISYLFGLGYADFSIAFEDILADPEGQITRLLGACRVQQNYDIKKLESLIESPPVGKWKSYADDEWFWRHETICETTLADFFSAMESKETRGSNSDAVPAGISGDAKHLTVRLRK